jgi:hypothetical protein
MQKPRVALNQHVQEATSGKTCHVSSCLPIFSLLTKPFPSSAHQASFASKTSNVLLGRHQRFQLLNPLQHLQQELQLIGLHQNPLKLQYPHRNHRHRNQHSTSQMNTTADPITLRPRSYVTPQLHVPEAIRLFVMMGRLVTRVSNVLHLRQHPPH